MNTNINRMIRRIAVTAGLLTAAIGTAAAQDPDSDPVIDQTPGGTNYISTRTFTNQSGTEYVTDVEYYDGLGYLVQKQSSHASPSGGVLVQPVVYDSMRRADATAYLPYASYRYTMTYRPDAVSEQGSWYASRFGGDRYAFSNTVYESGPQGRPVSTMKPGEVYRSNDKKATVTYGVNYDDDAVRRLSFDPSGFRVIPAGYYPEESIHKVTSTDEDGRASTVFSDAFGRTLLTRQYEGLGESGRRCDTYYVYDVRDSLVCVIQPEGSVCIDEGVEDNYDGESLSPDFLDRYCFTWKYDAWGNVLESHVPGGGTSYFVYDDRDRCTFFADSDMMEHSLCIHRVYDDLDRLTAEYYGSGMGNDFYDFALLRSMGYYDASGSHIPSGRGLEFQEDSIARLGMVRNDRCLMMPSYEFILECPDHNQQEDAGQDGGWVERAFYYDHTGRLIQTVEAGSDGWSSRYSTLYDFVGNVLATVETHTPPGGTADVLYTEYTYDQRGRMLTSLVTLNWDRQHEVRYGYDALGRMISKDFLVPDGEESLARESRGYNLQGWTCHMGAEYNSNEIFNEDIRYYDPQTGSAQFSGMISEKEHYRYAESWDCRNTNRYTYSYDGLGRLSFSAHFINGSLVDENFETGFRYDRNGNLLALQRYGIAANPFTHDYLADDLSYAYDGNRLERITNRALPQDETMETEDDPGTEYSFSYDSNGRITHDDHQGLDISYNVLNFPCRFYDVDAMTETSYIYLSDGSKRSVATHDGLGKLYRGSFVYKMEGSDDGPQWLPAFSLESVATPEGRLAVTDDGILDLWYAKDYLGNVRSVVDIASGVLEENDYLPFGTRIQDDNQPVMSDNRWRYANKEEQASLVGGSCDLIDFGARNYDPWSARWTTIDPMAQKYFSMSPYNYCAGNPVMLVDPDGAIIRIYYSDNSGKRKSYLYSGGECSNTNAYVQSVVSAYKYNKANWKRAGFSGKSQTEILIEREDKVINVSNRKFGKDSFNDEYETIYWDPAQGTKHKNGTTTSPATDFDHEADHANAYIDKKRQNGIAEEDRVINGSEQKMALANGDIAGGQRTRAKHSDGEIIIVDSVTSNVENKGKTEKYKKEVNSYNFFSQD